MHNRRAKNIFSDDVVDKDVVAGLGVEGSDDVVDSGFRLGPEML